MNNLQKKISELLSFQRKFTYLNKIVYFRVKYHDLSCLSFSKNKICCKSHVFRASRFLVLPHHLIRERCHEVMLIMRFFPVHVKLLENNTKLVQAILKISKTHVQSHAT